MDLNESIVCKYQLNKGVASKLPRLFGDCRIIDLLFYRPKSFINRYNFKKISRAKHDEVITVIARVEDYQCRKTKRINIVNVICVCSDEYFKITFFNRDLRAIKQWLKKDHLYIISGKILEDTMAHPDKILSIYDFSKLIHLEPKYYLTSGITNDYLCDLIQKVLSDLIEFPEWISKNIVLQKKWPSWKDAIKNYHFPTSLEFHEKSRQRLAYDEVTALYLNLHNLHDKFCSRKKEAMNGDKSLRELLIQKLGFELTDDQKSVSEEIFSLQVIEKTALMLLQGDVGSGKTVVAFLAILNAVECGKQAVLLVPTNVLANQHYENLKNFFPDLEIEKLVSSITQKKQKNIVEKVLTGESKIIIGTHSLLSDNIQFHDLGLVVIDEQHRFGAGQRTKLLLNNHNADLLMMSATPIPKTFTQILFNFLHNLTIKNKPKNRKQVKTAVIKSSRINDLFEKIKSVVSSGSKIFWVCPAIEESENMKLTSVSQRYELLKKHFGDDVDCVHGNLSQCNIDKIIEKFRDNKIKILVSTTVIEVGIDIPDADVIIIENAERFGLAQLHQLRGRVGRGDKDSSCILIYNDESELCDNAYQRLKTLKDSDDGFYISEQDFKIRGGGDLFGLKQSGLFQFKFINERKDVEIIKLAAEQVKFILQSNEISQYQLLLNMFFSSNNYYL